MDIQQNKYQMHNYLYINKSNFILKKDFNDP